MKKVEAVLQGFKLDQVKEALAKEKLPRITIFEVKGAGLTQAVAREYRGVQYLEDSVAVKIEIVVDDDEAERIARLIADVLNTDGLGDGEILIVHIEQHFRLRVGHPAHAEQSKPAAALQIREPGGIGS